MKIMVVAKICQKFIVGFLIFCCAEAGGVPKNDYSQWSGAEAKIRSKRSNIQCGKAFGPCDEGGGLRVVTLDRSHSDDPESVELRLPSDSLQNSLANSQQTIDLLFNQTEPQLLRSVLTADRLQTAADSRTAVSGPQPSAKDTHGSNGQSGTMQFWAAYTKSNSYAKDLSYSAMIAIAASQQLKNELNIAPFQAIVALPKVDVSRTLLATVCPANAIRSCVPGKYRSFNGYCNNVEHELWGGSHEKLFRYLNEDYADAIAEPRRSGSGEELPNAGDVAQSLIGSDSNRHKQCSLMVAQWAQFVYDDIAYLGSVRGSLLSPLACCDPQVQQKHPECFPLQTVQNGCLPYARTAPSPRSACQLGPREQMNMATSYLDASTIYGSTKQQAERLKDSSTGRLKTMKIPGLKNDLLPAADDASECKNVTQQRLCFQSGSERVNFLPTGTALYTLWMRQHNRIVDELKRLNPAWDADKVFLEARRIVGAQIQEITFNEFLPGIVGMGAMTKYGLELRSDGYYADYDMELDASTMNSFAVAAGQFFWSMFPDYLGKGRSQQPLSELFYNPSYLAAADGFDGLISFLLRERIEEVDLNITSELTEKFLKAGPGEFGLNLPAIIVHMGRDHGIPSYGAWRERCGLAKPANFNDLMKYIRDPDVLIPRLQKFYQSVDDLDLFLMGLAEIPTTGALVGPTFACILGLQFQRIRRSDRFWYENFFFPSSFTEDQLLEIRKTTLAGVICDNADKIGNIQPHVFMVEDTFENAAVGCSSQIIPTMNLTAWIDMEPKLKMPITSETLQKAIRLGTEQAKERGLRETNRLQNTERGTVPPGDPIFTHASILKAYPDALDQARASEILLETTKILVRGKLGASSNDDSPLPKDLDIPTLQRLLPKIDVSALIANVSANRESCNPKPFPCDHTSPYRTYTGWCNNLRFPQYGNTFNPFRRLLDPAYHDGFDEPRKLGSDGQPLPSPRLIANSVHQDIDFEPHVKYTHMLMQFAQFLDHDFTHSPVHQAANGSTLNCSRCDSRESVSTNCFPFEIPSNDPVFPANAPDGTRRCMGIARSLLGQLTLGYREQINQLTAFIDASTIYGSTECQAKNLRLNNSGLLNFTDFFEDLHDGLPQGFQEKECRTLPKHMCFVAGDSRSNEQTGLTAFHTAWLREHNRIAHRLQEINNVWTDEKIFQETRRIISAIVQHITFNEFLPKVMGMETMAKYGLLLEKQGFYHGYDLFCDATVSNEFATAAFRFGHTMIRSVFPMMDNDYQNISAPLQLRQMFFNATPLYQGGVDAILLGLSGYPVDDFDRHITADVRHHLFEVPNQPLTGMDLPAINIQRSRDHGLQPYIRYRQWCGFSRPRTFEDLSDTTSADAIQSLKQVYRSVDDIDLFPGLMTERSVRGGLLGPTMACIVADQFSRARRCDRFWYENDLAGVRFTPGQLAQIRKATLAKVICANSRIMHKMQPKIFDQPDDLLNTPVSCDDLPEMDLHEWQDTQICIVNQKTIDSGKASRVTPCVSCTCTHEGPQCSSVRINNCFKLITEFGKSAVLNDTACLIQCSAAIKQQNFLS